jgi:hypothetical protein
MVYLLAVAGETGNVQLWSLVGGLLAALGVVAKLELKRYDRLQERHDLLQDKMTDQLLPVITEFVGAARSTLAAMKDIASNAQLQQQLEAEREQRIRAEERLRTLERR